MQKLTSFVLSFLLIFTAIPMQVFAEDPPANPPAETSSYPDGIWAEIDFPITLPDPQTISGGKAGKTFEEDYFSGRVFIELIRVEKEKATFVPVRFSEGAEALGIDFKYFSPYGAKLQPNGKIYFEGSSSKGKFTFIVNPIKNYKKFSLELSNAKTARSPYFSEENGKKYGTDFLKLRMKSKEMQALHIGEYGFSEDIEDDFGSFFMHLINSSDFTGILLLRKPDGSPKKEDIESFLATIQEEDPVSIKISRKNLTGNYSDQEDYFLQADIPETPLSTIQISDIEERDFFFGKSGSPYEVIYPKLFVPAEKIDFLDFDYLTYRDYEGNLRKIYKDNLGEKGFFKKIDDTYIDMPHLAVYQGEEFLWRQPVWMSHLDNSEYWVNLRKKELEDRLNDPQKRVVVERVQKVFSYYDLFLNDPMVGIKYDRNVQSYIHERIRNIEEFDKIKNYVFDISFYKNDNSLVKRIQKPMDIPLFRDHSKEELLQIKNLFSTRRISASDDTFHFFDSIKMEYPDGKFNIRSKIDGYYWEDHFSLKPEKIYIYKPYSVFEKAPLLIPNKNFLELSQGEKEIPYNKESVLDFWEIGVLTNAQEKALRSYDRPRWNGTGHKVVLKIKEGDRFVKIGEMTDPYRGRDNFLSTYEMNFVPEYEYIKTELMGILPDGEYLIEMESANSNETNPRFSHIFTIDKEKVKRFYKEKTLPIVSNGGYDNLNDLYSGVKNMNFHNKSSKENSLLVGRLSQIAQIQRENHSREVKFLFPAMHKNQKNDFYSGGVYNKSSSQYPMSRYFSYIQEILKKEGVILYPRNSLEGIKENNRAEIDFYDIKNDLAEEDASLIIRPIVKEILPGFPEDPYAKTSLLLIPESELSAIDFDYMYYEDVVKNLHLVSKEHMGLRKKDISGRSYILLNPVRSYIMTQEQAEAQKNRTHTFYFVKGDSVKKVVKQIEDTPFLNRRFAKIKENEGLYGNSILSDKADPAYRYIHVQYSGVDPYISGKRYTLLDSNSSYSSVWEYPVTWNSPAYFESTMGPLHHLPLIVKPSSMEIQFRESYVSTLRETIPESQTEIDINELLKKRKMIQLIRFRAPDLENMRWIKENEISDPYPDYPKLLWAKKIKIEELNESSGLYEEVVTKENPHFSVSRFWVRPDNKKEAFYYLSFGSSQLSGISYLSYPGKQYKITITGTQGQEQVIDWTATEYPQSLEDMPLITVDLYPFEGDHGSVSIDMDYSGVVGYFPGNEGSGSSSVAYRFILNNGAFEDQAYVYHPFKNLVEDKKVARVSVPLKKGQTSLTLSRKKLNNLGTKLPYGEKTENLAFELEDGTISEEVTLDVSNPRTLHKLKMVSIGKNIIKVKPMEKIKVNSSDELNLKIQVLKGVRRSDGNYEYSLVFEDRADQIVGIPREDFIMLKIGDSQGMYKENILFEQKGVLQDFYLIENSKTQKDLDLNKILVPKVKQRGFYDNTGTRDYYVDKIDIYEKTGETWTLLREEKTKKGLLTNLKGYLYKRNSYSANPDTFIFPLQEMLGKGVFKIVYHAGEIQAEEILDTQNVSAFIESQIKNTKDSNRAFLNPLRMADPDGDRYTLAQKFEPYLREVEETDSIIRIAMGKFTDSGSSTYSGSTGLARKTKVPEGIYMLEPLSEEVSMISNGYTPGKTIKKYNYKNTETLEESISDYRDLVFKVPSAQLGPDRKVRFSVKEYNLLSNNNNYDWAIESDSYYQYLLLKNSEDTKYSTEVDIKIPEGKRAVYKDFMKENEVLYAALQKFPVEPEANGKNKLEDLKIYKKIGPEQKEYLVYSLKDDFYEGPGLTQFTEDARNLRLPVLYKDKSPYKMVYTWNGQEAVFDYGDPKPAKISGSFRDPKNYDLTDLRLNTDLKYEFLEEGVVISNSAPIPYPEDGIVTVTEIRDSSGNILPVKVNNIYVENTSKLKHLNFNIKGSLKDHYAVRNEQEAYRHYSNKVDEFFLKVEIGAPLSNTSTKISSNIPIAVLRNSDLKSRPMSSQVGTENNFILMPENGLYLDRLNSSRHEVPQGVVITAKEGVTNPHIVVRSNNINLTIKDLTTKRLYVGYREGGYGEGAKILNVRLENEEPSNSYLNTEVYADDINDLFVNLPKQTVRIDSKKMENVVTKKARDLQMGVNGEIKTSNIQGNRIRMNLNGKPISQLENVTIQTYDRTLTSGETQKGYLELSGYHSDYDEEVLLKNSKIKTTLLDLQEPYKGRKFMFENSSLIGEEIRYRADSINKIIFSFDNASFPYLERDLSGDYTEEEKENFNYFEKIASFKVTDGNQDAFLYRIPETYTNVSIEGYPYRFENATTFNGNYNVILPTRGAKTLHYTENGEIKQKLITPDLGYDINSLRILRLQTGEEPGNRLGEGMGKSIFIKQHLNPLLKNPYERGEELDSQLVRIKEDTSKFYVLVADAGDITNPDAAPGIPKVYQVIRRPLQELLDAGITMEYNHGVRMLRFKNPVTGDTFDSPVMDDLNNSFDYNTLTKVSAKFHLQNPFVPLENDEDFKNMRFLFESEGISEEGNTSSKRTLDGITFKQFLEKREQQLSHVEGYEKYVGDLRYQIDHTKKVATITVSYPFNQKPGQPEIKSVFTVPVLLKSNQFDVRTVQDIDFYKEGTYTKHLSLDTTPGEDLRDRTDFEIRLMDLNGNTWQGTPKQLMDLIKESMGYENTGVIFFRLPNATTRQGIKENPNIVPQKISYFGLYVKPLSEFEDKMIDMVPEGQRVYGFFKTEKQTDIEITSRQKLLITSYPAEAIPDNENITSATVKTPSLLHFLTLKADAPEEAKQNPREEHIDWGDIRFNIMDNKNIVAEDVDYAFLKAREMSIVFNPENNQLVIKNKKGEDVSKGYVYLLRNAGFQGNAIKSFKILDWKKEYLQGDPIDTNSFQFEVVDFAGVKYENAGREYMTYEEAKKILRNFRVLPNPEAEGSSMQPDMKEVRVLFNYYVLDEEGSAGNINMVAPIQVHPAEFDKESVVALKLIRKPFILMAPIEDRTPMNYAGMILELRDRRGAKKVIKFTNSNADDLFAEHYLTTNKPQGSLFLKEDGDNQTIEIKSLRDEKVKIYTGDGGTTIDDTVESVTLIHPPTFTGPYEIIRTPVDIGTPIDFKGMEVDVKFLNDPEIYRFKGNAYLSILGNKVNTPDRIFTTDIMKELLPKGNINESEVFRDIAWVPIGKKDDVRDNGLALSKEVKEKGFTREGFRVIVQFVEGNKQETEQRERDYVQNFKTNPLLSNDEIAKKAYVGGLSPYDPIVEYIKKNLPENADKIKSINTDGEGNRIIVYEDGTKVKIPAAVIERSTAKVAMNPIVLKLGEVKDVMFVAIPTATKDDYKITLQKEADSGDIEIEKIDPTTMTQEEKAFGNQKIKVTGMKIGQLNMLVEIVGNTHPDARKVVPVQVLPPDQAHTQNTKVVRGLEKEVELHNPQNVPLEKLKKNTSSLEKVSFEIKDDAKMSILAQKDKELGEYDVTFQNPENHPVFGDIKDFKLEVLKGDIHAEDIVVDLDKDAAGKEFSLKSRALNHEGGEVPFDLPEALQADKILFNNTGLLANKKVVENEFFKAEILAEGKVKVTPKKISDDFIEVPMILDATAAHANMEILEKNLRIKVKQDKVQQDIPLTEKTVIRGNTEEISFPEIHDRLKDEMAALKLKNDTLGEIPQIQFEHEGAPILRFKVKNNAPVRDYTISNNKDEINSVNDILNVSDFTMKVLKYTLMQQELNVHKDIAKKELLKAVLEDEGGSRVYSEKDKSSYKKEYFLLDEHDVSVDEVITDAYKITKENNILTLEGLKASNGHTVRIKIRVTAEKDTTAQDAQPVVIEEIVSLNLNVLDGDKNGQEKQMQFKHRLLGGGEDSFLSSFDKSVSYKLEDEEQYHLPIEIKDRVNMENKFYIYKATVFEEGKSPEIVFERKTGKKALSDKMIQHYVKNGGEVVLEYRLAGDILDTGTLGTLAFFLLGGLLIGAGVLYKRKEKKKKEENEK